MVIRSLIHDNISWGNLSTSRLWPLGNADTADRETGKFQVWVTAGIGGGNYIDHGAEETDSVAEVHIAVQPSSRNPSTVNNYKSDMEHLVEEIQRVVRQNRTNASGYRFIFIPRGSIVPMDVENDPDIDPPMLERLIRVHCSKYRVELT